MSEEIGVKLITKLVETVISAIGVWFIYQTAHNPGFSPFVQGLIIYLIVRCIAGIAAGIHLGLYKKGYVRSY